MRQWLEKLTWKLSLWMRGRYGPDKLSAFLLVLSFLFSISSGIFQTAWLALPCYACLGWGIFRCYSRNISARYAENQKYLQLTQPIRRWLNLQKLRWNGRKEYRYFRCPECGQIQRIPKGYGKIIITCKQCRHEFTRRS